MEVRGGARDGAEVAWDEDEIHSEPSQLERGKHCLSALYVRCDQTEVPHWSFIGWSGEQGAHSITPCVCVRCGRLSYLIHAADLSFPAECYACEDKSIWPVDTQDEEQEQT